MKYIKYIVLLFTIFLFILLIVFKNKTNFKEIIIIDEGDNYNISIIIPKTNIKKLDNYINDYIYEKEVEFFDSYADTDYPLHKDKLDINYKYTNFNNKYISIELKTTFKTYKYDYQINEVKTFLYDIKNNTLLNLNDILYKNSKEYIINEIRKDLLVEHNGCILPDQINDLINLNVLNNIDFYIDKENIVILYDYINLKSDHYDIIEIKIPLNKLSFNIKINNILKIEKTIAYLHIN